MGERLAERLDSCLLTDEQGNALRQPGQLAGELLQRSHEQHASRTARLAWGSPRGARPDANHSNTSIDVATLSHTIAEDIRKASKERRSEIEYAYPRPPKFEAVPNKFKLMRSMGRIISLACPPNKDQQRKREQRKREEIHAEVVAKFERQLARRQEQNVFAPEHNQERALAAMMLELRRRLQPAAVRAALAREDAEAEPSDGEKEQEVVVVTRRGLQKLEADGSSKRPELGSEQEERLERRRRASLRSTDLLGGAEAVAKARAAALALAQAQAQAQAEAEAAAEAELARRRSAPLVWDQDAGRRWLSEEGGASADERGDGHGEGQGQGVGEGQGQGEGEGSAEESDESDDGVMLYAGSLVSAESPVERRQREREAQAKDLRRREVRRRRRQQRRQQRAEAKEMNWALAGVLFADDETEAAAAAAVAAAAAAAEEAAAAAREEAARTGLAVVDRGDDGGERLGRWLTGLLDTLGPLAPSPPHTKPPATSRAPRTPPGTKTRYLPGHAEGDIAQAYPTSVGVPSEVLRQQRAAAARAAARPGVGAELRFPFAEQWLRLRVADKTSFFGLSGVPASLRLPEALEPLPPMLQIEFPHEELLPTGSDLDDQREARAARLLRQLVGVEFARPRLCIAPPRALAPRWLRDANTPPSEDANTAPSQDASTARAAAAEAPLSPCEPRHEAGVSHETRQPGSAFHIAPVEPHVTPSLPSLTLTQLALMRHYADADELLPLSVRPCHSACDLFLSTPSRRPRPRPKDKPYKQGLEVLEHIAAHTAAARAKMVHAKPPLAAEGAEAEGRGERARAPPASEREARPVKLSAAERARVQKALDDLQMPPREQLLFAAKYMAPGSKKLEALRGALPVYEEAAAAMRQLRRAAMKREAEVLGPASARARCAAQDMRARLGDHARFKGRPFFEIIAEIADGGGGGGGGGGGPTPATATGEGTVQQPPLS